MSYAAQVVEGKVTRVIVATGIWANDTLNGGQWVETPTKVGIGWTYTDGEFRPPQPYSSWIWDDGWIPPVSYPDDDLIYTWDEDTLTWVEISDV